jgi:superfamily I DNA/RNA helicase
MLDSIQERIKKSIVSSFSDLSMQNFIGVDSAPGSGKTTLIIASLVDAVKVLPAGKKLLVLAFSVKMTEEIKRKVEKDKTISGKVDVRGVNSFFFRKTKHESDAKQDYLLDYKKSFFSAKMIREAILSLADSDSQARYSEYIYDRLKSRFVFDEVPEVLMRDSSIKLIQAYVNAYYSSPFHITNITEIEKGSKFFLRQNFQPLSDLRIDFEHFSIIPNVGDLSLQHWFLKHLVSQIEMLAVLKDVKTVLAKEIAEIPIVVEELGQQRVSTKTIERNTSSFQYENIYQVPHNYYFKHFLNKAKKDPLFLQNAFQEYAGVVIDEAQDNDRILFEIVTMALQYKYVTSVAAIGDTWQSIFGFKSPDHFNLLQAIKQSSGVFASMGIRAEFHDMSQTYRFNKHIANAVNIIFGENKILGRNDDSGVMRIEPLMFDSLKTLIAASKERNEDVVIICRSNSEAIRIYMEMLKRNIDNVRLDGSVRQKFKDITMRGVNAIENESIREEVIGILVKEHGRYKDFTYEDIVKSKKAVDVISQSEGANFIFSFNYDDISEMLGTVDRRKKTARILTAHASKGIEGDHIVIADDYIKEKNNMPYVDLPSANQDNADFDVFEPSNDEKHVGHSELDELSMFASDEERNIFYVALTRAKKTVSFMEGKTYEKIKHRLLLSKPYNYDSIINNLLKPNRTDTQKRITLTRDHGKTAEKMEDYNLFNMKY